MAVAIFSRGFRDFINGTIWDAGGTYRFYAAGSRLGIYTSGNGLPQIETYTNHTGWDAYTTGRLIYFSGSMTYQDNPNNDYGLVTLSSGFQAASATGVAAEFLWISGVSSNCAVIGGTVSGPGGGGDMIIGDTSIVSGNNYRIQNWSMRLFEDFSV